MTPISESERSVVCDYDGIELSSSDISNDFIDDISYEPDNYIDISEEFDNDDFDSSDFDND